MWIVADASVDGSETGTSFKQALYFKSIGFNIHDTMIWNKNGFTATGALVARYAQVFEYMFVFSKGKPKTFNPIKDRKTQNYGIICHGTVRNPDGSMKPLSNPKPISEYGQRFNIWEQTPTNDKYVSSIHPATFPVNLVQDHIISWSNQGDTVFDPFMGSGTTAIASIKTNRHFFGTEISKEYYEKAKARIDAEKAQFTLFDYIKI